MKFKLDENLGERGAELFRSAGWDVETVVEEGLCGANDRDVFETCLKESRCLVTLDMDFGNPLVFDPKTSAGLMVIRLPKKAGPGDLWEACATAIEALKEHQVSGRLWIVSKDRVRIYQAEAE